MNRDPHFFHQTDLSLEMQILNISVNLARLGNWINDLDQLKQNNLPTYQSRLELIKKIIDQTESYLRDLENEDVSDRFQLTLDRFKQYFQKLKSRQNKAHSFQYWSETVLTWANILQHRARLAEAP